LTALDGDSHSTDISSPDEKSGMPDGRFTYAINAGKPTKELDLTTIDDERKNLVTVKCVYKLDRDRLILAWPLDDDAKRPVTFEPKAGVMVLALVRQARGSDDRIGPAKAETDSGPTEARLAGRWQLITDNKSAKDQMELDFVMGKQPRVVVTRDTTTPILGLTNLYGHTKTTMALVMNPSGRKDALGIVENVDEKTGDVTVCGVLFYFRGETLELSGSPHAGSIGAINLTGQWKRIPNK
jgi:uncharacterized protein (TIGR03067 family)